jgi:hypothetical protein
MKPLPASLFTVEVAICFFPAMTGMLIWFGGFFLDLGNEHLTLSDHLEHAALLLAGSAGLAGAVYMFIYVMGGRREISRTAMALFTLCGLSLSGYIAAGFLRSGAPLLLTLPFSAPFLCGLHPLYLGRSYFSSANKTMEPTR